MFHIHGFVCPGVWNARSDSNLFLRNPQFLRNSKFSGLLVAAVALDFLFAAKSGNSSHRLVETLTPVAEATNLPFNADIKDADYGTTLIPTLAGEHYANSNILICWHHGTLVQLAGEPLGVNDQARPNLTVTSTWPTKYDCNTFGWLFQIRYDATGTVQVDWTRCLNERLMNDDTINPP